MKLDQLMNAAKAPPTDHSADTARAPQLSRDLEVILSIFRKINTSLVLTDVLDLVIDEAIRIAHAQRGFLMLANKDRKLDFVIGRDAEGKLISADSFRVSSSVLEDVLATGESVCIESAMTHERFVQRESITNLELQTILCSALRTRDESIGVIYVDSKSIQPINKVETLRFFEILAGQAAIAIKNARLYHDLDAAYNELKSTNSQIIEFERMAMKGEIAAEVSHELKNHVAVALSSLQGLQRGLGTIPVEEARTMTESAMYATKKIQKFSQTFLTRSRANAVKTSTSLSAVVYHFVDFIRTLPKFRRNVIQLGLANDLPNVEIDLDQIQQVLLNLVGNASEASATATIELKTALDSTSHDVMLIVRDDGPGIPMEVQQKLFHEKITTKPDGHGYGLPICKQIIENHGGHISLESLEHQGTTFFIALPISPDGAAKASAPETQHA